MKNKRCSIPMAEMVPFIREAVRCGGQAEMTVTGYSMMPLLKDRISSVRLTSPDNLKKGDIVLFLRHDGHYVLHRIIAVHNGSYDIAGDSQTVIDKDISGSDIIAKVSAYNRSGCGWKKNDAFYRAVLPVIKTAGYYGRKIKRKLKEML